MMVLALVAARTFLYVTYSIEMIQNHSKNTCIRAIFSEIVNLYTGKLFITTNNQLFFNIYIFLMV